MDPIIAPIHTCLGSFPREEGWKGSLRPLPLNPCQSPQSLSLTHPLSLRLRRPWLSNTHPPTHARTCPDGKDATPVPCDAYALLGMRNQSATFDRGSTPWIRPTTSALCGTKKRSPHDHWGKRNVRVQRPRVPLRQAEPRPPTSKRKCKQSRNEQLHRVKTTTRGAGKNWRRRCDGSISSLRMRW